MYVTPFKMNVIHGISYSRHNLICLEMDTIHMGEWVTVNTGISLDETRKPVTVL